MFYNVSSLDWEKDLKHALYKGDYQRAFECSERMHEVRRDEERTLREYIKMSKEWDDEY